MEETQPNSKSPVALIVVVVLAIVVIGGYIAMNKGTISTNTSMTNIEPTTALANTGNTTETSNATEIVIDGSEFAFTPVTLTFTAGQPVTIVFKNVGKMPHDFVIDEIPDAKTSVIQGGQTETITFTPTARGTYKFYCSVGNHRAQGMEGTVTVQ